MAARRIILDTDPGIDDALAILLALASPELQLEAVTVTSGNCSTAQGVVNALKVLELARATHVPVAPGLDRPLLQPLLTAPETHGDTARLRSTPHPASNRLTSTPWTCSSSASCRLWRDQHRGYRSLTTWP